jgi:hypothetical protein
MSKITSIEFVGYEDSIDIELDGDRLFYANGLVSHNSGAASSDPEMTDVSEAWGLPATADFFLIVIQSAELEELGQYLVKQEKSRYDDKGKHRKFTIGVDKSRMKLYDLDSQPFLAGNQYDADIPVFDNTEAGERLGFEEFRR